MKSILLCVNTVTILMMFLGALKLRQGIKSKVSNAFFVLALCLCIEVTTVSILLFFQTLTLGGLLIRILARGVELGGTIWFMYAILCGNRFIEVMLYKDRQTNGN